MCASKVCILGTQKKISFYRAVVRVVCYLDSIEGSVLTIFAFMSFNIDATNLKFQIKPL